MQHLCKDSDFSDFGKFWKISKVKIHKYFFFISFQSEFILLIRIQKKKNLKDRHFRKENSFFAFENCGKFSRNFGKCNALGPSIPLKEYVYKFSARLLKNSSKNMV